MKRLVSLFVLTVLLSGNVGCGLFNHQGACCNSCCGQPGGAGRFAWGGATYVGHPMTSMWSGGEDDCPNCGTSVPMGVEVIGGAPSGATTTPVLPSPAPEPGM